MEDRSIVLDTDVVIDFFMNALPAADVVADLILRKKAATTVISAFELYAGVTGRKRLKQIGTLFEAIPVLSFQHTEAVTAGRIYTQLKSKGTLIGTDDILIAAICTTRELPLYTNNIEHFRRVENLTIYRP